LELPGAGGLETLQKIKERHPQLPVLIMTANRDVETIVNAMQAGAYDYLAKPLDKTKLNTSVRNAVDKYELVLRLSLLEREEGTTSYAGIIGRSKPMRRLYADLEQVAASRVTVLIRGESGTGKELVAKAIHDHSPRASGPFVALNCAALPEQLVESEFFGHERGAFTGANAQRKGRLEQAHGGTLFLDEIAELDLSLQAKLLRALQERRFHRVGGTTEISSDFRVIAASHRDLALEAAEGRFREDLYFRLAVFEVDVPPLRERENDLVLLADHFLRTYAEEDTPRLSDEALALLRQHSFPGNVRELQNAMQRAIVVCRDGTVTPEQLPARLREAAATVNDEEQAPGSTSEPLPTIPPARLEELERGALERVLSETGNNLAEAARRLGIGRTTIYRKLKKYNLTPR
jgi:DNA-binding NtrC family response regulator